MFRDPFPARGTGVAKYQTWYQTTAPPPRPLFRSVPCSLFLLGVVPSLLHCSLHLHQSWRPGDPGDQFLVRDIRPGSRLMGGIPCTALAETMLQMGAPRRIRWIVVSQGQTAIMGAWIIKMLVRLGHRYPIYIDDIDQCGN